MRRLPLPRAFLPALVVLSVAGAGLVHSAASSRSAGAGMIVFASDRLKSEPGEIYSLAPATAPRDVSRSLAPDYGLAVAPAGDLIAFWSGRTGNDQIYRGDRGGQRREHRLLADLRPGGTRIAFLHGTSTSVALETVAATGGARASVLPPGKGYRGTPVWSPDGSKIAFVSGGGSIWAVAATGGEPERIATIPQGKSRPCGGLGLARSPDGKQFAAGGTDGVYLITLGKSASAKLAIRAPCAEYPSFSPDGKQIAFDAQPAHALGTQTAIMVANVDGSGLRTLTTVPFRQSVHPTWQPSP
jgi:Tol biopolymer transport system component